MNTTDTDLLLRRALQAKASTQPSDPAFTERVMHRLPPRRGALTVGLAYGAIVAAWVAIPLLTWACRSELIDACTAFLSNVSLHSLPLLSPFLVLAVALGALCRVTVDSVSSCIDALDYKQYARLVEKNLQKKCV